ncbi:hypothetical protein Tco_0247584 [Tanacetum coccineum]
MRICIWDLTCFHDQRASLCFVDCRILSSKPPVMMPMGMDRPHCFNNVKAGPSKSACKLLLSVPSYSLVSGNHSGMFHSGSGVAGLLAFRNRLKPHSDQICASKSQQTTTLCVSDLPIQFEVRADLEAPESCLLLFADLP